MKIAIDGFALGIRNGTGLTTYSRELAGTLIRAGHQVDAVFGLNGVGSRESLLRSRWLQALAVRGEPGASAWWDWLRYLPPYLAVRALGRPLSLRMVSGCSLLNESFRPEGLPAFHRVFNLPSLHRVAQAKAGILGTSLRIRAPDGVEVYHRTSPLPVRMDGVANVVTAHDVIPLALPQSTAINLLHYKRIMQASLRSADAIAVVSEHSRQDLLTYLDLPSERLHVTYQSVHIPESLRTIAPDLLDTYLQRGFGLRAGGYLLFHGAIEPKKNLMRILDAHQLARTDLPLVVVGREGWLCENEIRRLGALGAVPQSVRAGGRVRRIEYVPFRQLMYLLKGARALVFPSLYEGFGLPVLEAMEMGTPVITSNTGALKEVAGSAARLVDPLSAEEIALAIDELASDDTLCANLAARGRERAEFFSPQRHLERLEAAYRSVLA